MKRLLLSIPLVLLSTFPTIIGAAAAARKAIGGTQGMMAQGTEEVFDPNGVLASDARTISQVEKGWTIPPLCTKDILENVGGKDRELAQVLVKELGSLPLSCKFRLKSVGRSSSKSGGSSSSSSTGERYRALVTLGSAHPANLRMLSRAKKLRAVWSAGIPFGSPAMRRGGSSSSGGGGNSQEDILLTGSYEEASERMHPSRLELEILLPKKRGRRAGKSPSVVYTFPLVTGTMDKKNLMAPSRGKVRVFPSGRPSNDAKDGDNDSDGGLDVGMTSLHVSSGTSLVDWTWAKGKRLFWEHGRKV
eukprot:CAMPEP_0184857030 /NCGR_PEP_ID=MMETSP0580-20130426/2205_1 /TAXON_ID=1118495 /ORGANISM="Dactyliosolen fragilissimus" /LENGTH=303 /DNA_ID=CAMNT_0027352393 /DNA_START=95 /DNA_END=1003 /DNA_ORIENTATION=+